MLKIIIFLLYINSNNFININFRNNRLLNKYTKVIRHNNIKNNIINEYIECNLEYLENKIKKIDKWILSYKSFINKDKNYPNINNFINKYYLYDKKLIKTDCYRYEGVKVECKKCLKYYKGGAFKGGFILPANNKTLNRDIWKIDECMFLNKDNILQIKQLKYLIADEYGYKQYMQSYCLLE